jgi:hypothetical protein
LSPEFESEPDCPVSFEELLERRPLPPERLPELPLLDRRPTTFEATTATPDATSATLEATSATRFSAPRVVRVVFLAVDWRPDDLRFAPRFAPLLRALEALRLLADAPRFDAPPRLLVDARLFLEDVARPPAAADAFRLLPLLLLRVPDLRAAIKTSPVRGLNRIPIKPDSGTTATAKRPAHSSHPRKMVRLSSPPAAPLENWVPPH